MKYFLIGIKGSGMSSLALVLNGMGHEVIGCDIDDYVFTQKKIEEKKIPILKFGEYEYEDEDFVVIGNAFSDNHEEVKKVNKNKKRKYYEILDEISSKKHSIAISGTNGKTTTTSMLVESLKHKNPSYLIGDGLGYGTNKSELFVFEACEYKSTFLNYHPHTLVINNIEMDHPDYFNNLEHVILEFQKFADNSNQLIINGDDENVKKIKHKNISTYGLSKNHTLNAREIKYTEKGINVELYYKKKILGVFLLPFYGEHMLYNSLAVILANLELGERIEVIMKNLLTFKGAQRRFSEMTINKSENIYLIDDYAHHPSAIELTLNAVNQKYPSQEILTIFQPHTYSRTKEFLKEFAQTLSISDKVCLADIFGSARENTGDITINDLKVEIEKINSTKLLNFEDIDFKQKNICYCLLGAGNIDVLYKNKIIERVDHEFDSK